MGCDIEEKFWLSFLFSQLEESVPELSSKITKMGLVTIGLKSQGLELIYIGIISFFFVMPGGGGPAAEQIQERMEQSVSRYVTPLLEMGILSYVFTPGPS
jgi:hypothetical protein